MPTGELDNIGELIGSKPAVISVEDCLDCGKGFYEWAGPTGWHKQYCAECAARRRQETCAFLHGRAAGRTGGRARGRNKKPTKLSEIDTIR